MRAEQWCRMAAVLCRDLSYETDSGLKTKTVWSANLWQGGGDDGGGDIPTTLIRGVPHFDILHIHCTTVGHMQILDQGREEKSISWKFESNVRFTRCWCMTLAHNSDCLPYVYLHNSDILTVFQYFHIFPHNSFKHTGIVPESILCGLAVLQYLCSQVSSGCNWKTACCELVSPRGSC